MIFFEYFSLPKITFFYDLESEIRCKGTTFFLIMQINCYFFAYGKAKGAKDQTFAPNWNSKFGRQIDPIYRFCLLR